MRASLNTFLAILLIFCSGALLAQEIQEIEEDALVIEGFQVTGNKITKEYIILRELVFGIGDTIKKIELIPSIQQCKENLLNTSLFNFVNFDISHQGNSRINVLIEVTERWYIWPVPILEHADRNFATFLKERSWDKINYGFWLHWRNFLGRNQVLSLKFRLGYMKELVLKYEIPNLGKKQQHYISFGTDLNHQNEIYARTQDNRPVEFNPGIRPAEKRYQGFFHYKYRPKLYSSHRVSLVYDDWQVVDSVVSFNPEYLGNGATQSRNFTFVYEYKYDFRDSKAYPLEGLMLEASLTKLGLGIMPDFEYGSTRLSGIVMFHQKLGGPFYFYNATKGRYSTEKHLPHYLNRALGYREYLSGYELYVIDGSDYVISKYGLKYQLLSPRVYTVPYIPFEQFNKIHYAFYINLFADVGYVRNDFPDIGNFMNNQLQSSIGIGLDFVTYYDQVFRFEYSLNRFGEHGFYFHVETPFMRW